LRELEERGDQKHADSEVKSRKATWRITRGNKPDNRCQEVEGPIMPKEIDGGERKKQAGGPQCPQARENAKTGEKGTRGEK